MKAFMAGCWQLQQFRIWQSHRLFSACAGGEAVSKHIIKYDYRDGAKLAKHEMETWCGHVPQFSDWLFQDAQHALLSIEQGSFQVPCKNCLAAIIKAAQEVK
ncbi:hypothetical protein ACQCOG_17305 [Escherichia coli]